MGMIEPYYTTDLGTLCCGDCLEWMPGFARNSIDTIITDPPYALEFMGKGWDKVLPDVEIWKEALRVAKPGAMLMAFGGTRTYHRLTCAIEDAGWEIRDCVMWVYGSGFPKSLDISKQLDLYEKKKWMNISKAIDKTDKMLILDIWKNNSSNAIIVGNPSRKNQIEAGTNTQKNDSVPDLVLFLANPKKLIANAIIAELRLSEAHLTAGGSTFFVQENVEVNTERLQCLVKFAGKSLPSQNAMSLGTFTVQCVAKGLLNEISMDNLKAEEVLKTLNGNQKSLNEQAISALCAELIDGLKLTILNQSKTFLSLDTKSQTEIVSATTAIITESMAANLISSTVSILKSKAIDRMAGAEREVIGKCVPCGMLRNRRTDEQMAGSWSDPCRQPNNITAPATPEAQTWDGYGTALKPSYEPIVLAMKPLDGTFAENALKWGVAGLWIDGGRIGTEKGWPASESKFIGWKKSGDSSPTEPRGEGRWPANLIHDGSEEVVGLFPVTKSGSLLKHHKRTGGMPPLGTFEIRDRTGETEFIGDSGSAARFFYTAKTSRSERGEGNTHPTVKPLALIEYLCKLTRMPDNGIVLDIFGGSGTTAVACEKLGRPWILIEKELESCVIAKNRLSAATRQQKLFPVSGGGVRCI